MKNIMRTIFLCILICLFLPLTAFAVENNTYDLNELGMRIDIPSDHVVFTREISANDPNLSAYGLTKDGLSSLMLERNIYLNAWDRDINYEIIVTMIDSPFEDFNQFSDTSLSALTSSLAEEYKSVGITYISSEIHQHSQAKFLKIYISQPNSDDTTYGLQYYTVYNGKAINVTLQSYSGKIDSGKESMLKGIIDTVHFDTDPQLNNSPAQTVAFTYVDDNSGMSFTVPANWSEAPMNEEREFIDAKFTSNSEEGLAIIFASEDLWKELSETEKNQFSRSDIDNSIFTKADIAEMCGCKESDVATTIFAGKEYYYAEVTTTGTAYGLTVSLPTIFYIRCDNGYMYMFQFFGERSSPYYDDFKDLMNSVVYPAPSKNDATTNRWKQFSIGNIIVSLIITIAVYSLPIIIYRYAIRKVPVDNKTAKRITIIYGIVAFILMSIIIFAVNGSGAAGGAILLWSWVNYKVLIGGKKNSTAYAIAEPARDFTQPTSGVVRADTQSQNIAISSARTSEDQQDKLDVTTAEENQMKFCCKCGTKLNNDSLFCHKCGAKVNK